MEDNLSVEKSKVKTFFFIPLEPICAPDLLDSQQGCVPCALADVVVVSFIKLISVLALAKMNISACMADPRSIQYSVFHMPLAQKIPACSHHSFHLLSQKPWDSISSALFPELDSDTYVNL